MKKGARGVIIANEQGLGKTITALAIINGGTAMIVTPNTVVTTWAEEEEKFFPSPTLEILEGSYSERQKSLSSIQRPQLVTNIEFMRGMTPARKAELSRFAHDVLVVDEADYLGNIGSQQSKGTRELDSGFKMLLTATPFKRPSQINHILGFLRPDDKRFSSARAFTRAFPAGSAEALNALFLLLNEHTIRVRKQDVFEEYDPDVPLEKQSDRLPKKVEIDPNDGGRFNLTEEQCQSIQELFTDYQKWCRKHKGRESEEDTRYYRYKEGYFSKREALRQIMNDPAYIGRSGIKSPKHQKMDEIVKRELAKDPQRKALIFCRYKAQVEEYQRRYNQYGVRTYYGGLRANSNGYKIDESGKVLYYEVDKYENYRLDGDNRFIPSDKGHGRPIRALDYERILFQRDPKSRVMAATYDQGALGVTLTAADVVIYDDLAPTYRDQYQAGDRAHRIDNERKKYNVTYYWLQARYSNTFSEKVSSDIWADYFETGTYDEVHFANLRRQKRIFHRIMDGIGSDVELGEAAIKFMREKMPFLFVDSEQAAEEENYSENSEAAEGSPADCLEMIKNSDALIRKARNRDEGIRVSDVAKLRPFHPRTVYREFKTLKGLGIFVPVEGGRGYYRFSDMMIGPDENYTKTFINTISDMRYRVGKTGEERPLHRGSIPGEKIGLVKELVKMTILHQINLMQRPDIPDDKVLWHILEGGVVSVSQQSSFAQRVNNAAEKSKAPERIYIMRKGESIDEAIAGISKNHPNAVFDIALSDESHIENVPGDIKRLVFKGEAGDVAQLEGIVAALRALHGPKDDIIPTLKRIYAALKGSVCRYEIPPDALNDPVRFAHSFIFDLPPAIPIPVDEIRKMNERLLKLLIAA